MRAPVSSINCTAMARSFSAATLALCGESIQWPSRPPAPGEYARYLRVDKQAGLAAKGPNGGRSKVSGRHSPPAIVAVSGLLRQQIAQVIRTRTANFVNPPRQHERACP